MPSWNEKVEPEELYIPFLLVMKGRHFPPVSCGRKCPEATIALKRTRKCQASLAFSSNYLLSAAILAAFYDERSFPDIDGLLLVESSRANACRNLRSSL